MHCYLATPLAPANEQLCCASLFAWRELDDIKIYSPFVECSSLERRRLTSTSFGPTPKTTPAGATASDSGIVLIFSLRPNDAFGRRHIWWEDLQASAMLRV
jgi:hypothetical protein